MNPHDRKNDLKCKLPAHLTSSGVYALCQPGNYKDEAMKFLLEKLGNKIESISNTEDFFTRPYGVARLLLSREHWNQYCWIEKYGTLEGFSEQALDCSLPGQRSTDV